jgi:hypothetical protein
MFNSVRVRLTFWYTAAMACVLVVLAVVVYLLLERNTIHRTDATVAELAEAFLKTVNAEVRDALSSGDLQEGVSVAISEHRFRDTVFVVTDEDGNVVAASEERIPASESSDNNRSESLAELMRRITPNKRTFQTVHIGKHRYRRYIRNFSVERKNCTLIVLQSLRPQEEFLETLTGTFALVIPLAILLAGSGGYLLARRSLSPVAAMGTEAVRIGADNLHELLPIRNSKD